MNDVFRIKIWLVSVVLIAGAGCGPDDDQRQEGPTQLVVRYSGEPDNLHPMRARSSLATPIIGLLMPVLAEFDPQTLELSPLLVKELATIDTITEGQYSGGLRFNYEMRPEARWDDSSAVTGHDYAFTVKAALNPKFSTGWKGYLSFISDVIVDPADARKFSVIVPEPYMLAEVVTCNFSILPKYVYDPAGLLDSFTVSDLADTEGAQELGESDPRLQEFATAFEDARFSRDVVSGAGAYKLVEWETDQHLILERKAHWWGDEVQDAPKLLHAYPDRIVYRIIPDETTAISALKDGTVDLVNEISARNFLELRNDTSWSDELQFFTPRVMQVNYLELNNRHPILRDKHVRKALAYGLNYDAIMEAIVLGLADRTVGPFHPDKDYYNRHLSVIEQNLEEARRELADGGWADSDQDGTVDKSLDGQHTELNLDILVTQKEEGQQIAMVLKENAARIGIEIDIVTIDGSALQQAIRKRDFEIMALRSSTSPAPNDPYNLWHSESDVPGGRNRSGFRSARADQLIEKIRSAPSEEERRQYYLEFQELLYEEQPAIFLYVPQQRIVASREWEFEPSSRRPGFFENLFVWKPGNATLSEP